MAPLAGKQPFATNEPDTFYQSSPQARPRPPPQQQQRPAAYNDQVYDNHLSPGNNSAPANRNSGIDALGMGFMNGDMDDDSDDEEDMRRARSPGTPTTPSSKHAALAAATGASPSKSSEKGAHTPERFQTPPPVYNNQSPARSPIAAPRPGYANAVPALNQSAAAPARPAPAAAPAGRGPPEHLRINPPAPHSPHSPAHHSPYGPVSPSGSPHPLQAPVTPITPVFARPQRSNTVDSSASVSFSDTRGLIMRGEKEETLLPRGRRGEKGEQFWRRFSMVAHDADDEKRPSSWLTKTQGGASRLSRWVWLVGIILVVAAIGGIGLGVYTSQTSNSHKRPEAIGGSAEQGQTVLSTHTTATKSLNGSAKGGIGGASSTRARVTPTNEVPRRRAAPRQVAPHIVALRNRHTH
ncbi:hypothetical protein C8J57DRAFT_1165644 [Mycena rebaudengoi]|nr:hypothetical protein C8J57DRAFT_1165644 [Mycena rebaudengoi]